MTIGTRVTFTMPVEDIATFYREHTQKLSRLQKKKKKVKKKDVKRKQRKQRKRYRELFRLNRFVLK